MVFLVACCEEEAAILFIKMKQELFLHMLSKSDTLCVALAKVAEIVCGTEGLRWKNQFM